MADTDKNVNQTATSGRDTKQVAGNNKETQKIFIGVFFLFIIALGGLSWTFAIGLNRGGQSSQVEQKTEKK
ncbi:hypothetical protein [Pseudanabaena sp. 'Roaring Creek']|jgi:hypothetical protein|uniref:hypothetical protein n=1 Tax=Pseudanabaena sp. 'Roaring Creek' TaxID=1681830 RepID=UPI0006D80978|nr:hypothetical protein [Pseudanabaena sp. 'Roaring Creek']